MPIQWAYLPDFASFHMRGHWDDDGTAMIEAVRAAVGDAGLPVRSFPWWALGLAAPFVPLCRELGEMRYLWRRRVRMDNARLIARLGVEPHTPLHEAVRATLGGLGCLPEPSAAVGAGAAGLG